MPRRSAGGYLTPLRLLWRDLLLRSVVVGTLIIVATIFATRPVYKPIQKQSSANQADQKTSDKVDSNGLLGISPDAWTAIFTGTLTLFTGLLVTTGYVQIRYLIRADETGRKSADAAKKSADVARDTLIATQRAWIQIGNPTHEGDLVCHSNGMALKVVMPVINVGNSPAIDVRLKVWIGLFGPAGYDGADFTKTCEEKRLDNTGFKSASVFPRNEISNWVDLDEVAFADIESCNNGIVMLNTGEITWNPLLMGCVDYSIPSDPSGRHQTRFVYRVYSDREILVGKFAPGEAQRYRIAELRPFRLFANFYAD